MLTRVISSSKPVFVVSSRAVTGAGETCAALLLVNKHTNTEIQILQQGSFHIKRVIVLVNSTSALLTSNLLCIHKYRVQI